MIHGSQESVEVGQNLKIWDEEKKRGVLVQIIETQLTDIPGMLEDLIRNESIPSDKITTNMPDDLGQYINDVRDTKIIITKIRKEISNDDVISWTGWIPDRRSSVEPINDEWLMTKLDIGKNYPIHVGNTIPDRTPLNLSAYDIQEGGTCVIIGKKGTGKSHAAKIILKGLLNHGAKCIVFDINAEYSQLDKSSTDSKINNLNPGHNLQFLLEYIGLDVISDVLRKSLKSSQPSLYELSRAWKGLKRNNTPITLDTILSSLDSMDVRGGVNKAILHALERRFEGLKKTNLITDEADRATTLENELRKIPNGGALVFNLRGRSSETVNIVVSTILTKLSNLLEHDINHDPVFLFAEEAHMYIGETDWDNIITRMRHLGTFQFYITNTPSTLPETLIRQTDNLFLFNLQNDEDFAYMTKAIRLDRETTTSIGKTLPPGTCLVIGNATREFPFVIKTVKLDDAAGETRRFFYKDDSQKPKSNTKPKHGEFSL